jgi:hypothetical protein
MGIRPITGHGKTLQAILEALGRHGVALAKGCELTVESESPTQWDNAPKMG